MLMSLTLSVKSNEPVDIWSIENKEEKKTTEDTLDNDAQQSINNLTNFLSIIIFRIIIASRRLIFSLKAFFETSAALSYPICGFKAVTSIKELFKL